jgi:hypothetical protein
MRHFPGFRRHQGRPSSSLLSAESAFDATERSTADSGRRVLARSLELASSRAAAIPPAVALPVSDVGTHEGSSARQRPDGAGLRAPRRSASHQDRASVLANSLLPTGQSGNPRTRAGRRRRRPRLAESQTGSFGRRGLLLELMSGCLTRGAGTAPGDDIGERAYELIGLARRERVRRGLLQRCPTRVPNPERDAPIGFGQRGRCGLDFDAGGSDGRKGEFPPVRRLPGCLVDIPRVVALLGVGRVVAVPPVVVVEVVVVSSECVTSCPLRRS